MSDPAVSTALGTVLVAAVILIVILWIRIRRLATRLTEKEAAERARRTRAVKQSRSTHLGFISEQLAPLLPGFRYSPKDVQWIGGTVDAVVWNHLEDGGEVEIVFLDVKTGRSRLTERQRRIRDAITWRRVAFEEYRPPETQPVSEAALLELPEVIEFVSEDVLREDIGATGAVDTYEPDPASTSD
jgi:predicted Holliday junction resolvase-like endonuclease